MSDPAKVIELGASSNMTPKQALGLCSREEWEDVVIVGYHAGDGDLVVRASKMSRRDCLWLAEQLRLYALRLI